MPCERGEGAQHVRGVARGVAHRQPARAAPAEGRARDGPLVDAVVLAVGVDRQGARGDAHARRGDRGDVRTGAGVELDDVAPAGALPGEVDAVVVEVEPRDGGVVAEVVGLVGIHLGHERERARIGQEPPLDPLGAGLAQGAREAGEAGRIQRRVAAAREHEVAAQRAALHRPGGQQARLEAVLGPEPVVGVGGGDGLEAGGGRLAAPGLARLQQPPVGGVEDGEGNHAAQGGALHQRVDRGRRGRLAEVGRPRSGAQRDGDRTRERARRGDGGEAREGRAARDSGGHERFLADGAGAEKPARGARGQPRHRASQACRDGSAEGIERLSTDPPDGDACSPA